MAAEAVDPPQGSQIDAGNHPDPDHPQCSAHGDSNNLEATELRRIKSRYTSSTAIRRPASITPRPNSGLGLVRYEVSKFWKNQISIIVPHDTCRDHLALERTFLGYLRTSAALSMIGVTVAQLFRLQHTPTPSPIFGFFVLGKPLACICQGAAIYTLLLGTYRSWRIQNAIVRGKAIAGGFEIVFMWLGIVVLCITFLALLIAIDITKEY